MDISKYLLKSLIRHSSKVVSGFDNPDHVTRENARLLKKDIEKLQRLINKANSKGRFIEYEEDGKRKRRGVIAFRIDMNSGRFVFTTDENIVIKCNPSGAKAVIGNKNIKVLEFST